jgi:hypothetical protein
VDARPKAGQDVGTIECWPWMTNARALTRRFASPK